MRSSFPIRFLPLLASSLGILAAAAAAESLRLKDGTVLQGEIISRDDSTMTLRNAVLGDIRVPLAALAASDAVPAPAQADPSDAEVSGGGRRRSGQAEPADHALFFLPTAFTPPKGSFMFRDFELLFLTFGFAPTGSTTATAGFMFPVTAEFQVLTAGVKQQLWAVPDERMAVALTGNITKPLADFSDDLGFLVNSSLVGSIRAPNPTLGLPDAFGAHLALGYLGLSDSESDWDGSFSLGVGVEARATPNAKFMVEVLSAAPFDPEDEFGGILTIGVRLHGARLAADIAGLRPLGEDADGLVLWPLLVVSYRI